MEKLPEELDAKLEQLLLQKDYDQLTDQERAYVKDQLSPTMYAGYRKLLLNANQLFEKSTEGPDPAIRSSLLKHVKARKVAQPSIAEKIKQLLNYPIPSWQVALGCLVLTMSFYFFDMDPQKGATPTDSTVNQPTEPQQPAGVIDNSQPVKEDKELLNLLTGV